MNLISFNNPVHYDNSDVMIPGMMSHFAYQQHEHLNDMKHQSMDHQMHLDHIKHENMMQQHQHQHQLMEQHESNNIIFYNQQNRHLSYQSNQHQEELHSHSQLNNQTNLINEPSNMNEIKPNLYKLTNEIEYSPSLNRVLSLNESITSYEAKLNNNNNNNSNNHQITEGQNDFSGDEDDLSRSSSSSSNSTQASKSNTSHERDQTTIEQTVLINTSDFTTNSNTVIENSKQDESIDKKESTLHKSIIEQVIQNMDQEEGTKNEDKLIKIESDYKFEKVKIDFEEKSETKTSSTSPSNSAESSKTPSSDQSITSINNDMNENDANSESISVYRKFKMNESQILNLNKNHTEIKTKQQTIRMTTPDNSIEMDDKEKTTLNDAR